MTNETNSMLAPSDIADFRHPKIEALIKARRWKTLPVFQRIGAVYTFVRDEVAFGYNATDAMAASDVLNDGYGQCNTKGNLLLALLRGVGIPARFHGFTIDKELQKGAIPWWLFPLAPPRILHSWVEVQLNDEWIPLEGFILDKPYLESLQKRFGDSTEPFCGYGVATDDLQAPDVDWVGSATYIQKNGIADDFGLFDSPDEFYAKHGTNLSGLRRWLYERFFRHAMNRTVDGIRRSNRARAATSPPAMEAQ